jgi:hypothetical protein
MGLPQGQHTEPSPKINHIEVPLFEEQPLGGRVACLREEQVGEVW